MHFKLFTVKYDFSCIVYFVILEHSLYRPRLFSFLRANHFHCHHDGPATLTPHVHVHAYTALCYNYNELLVVLQVLILLSLVALSGFFVPMPEIPSFACFILYQLILYFPIYRSFLSFGPPSKLNIVFLRTPLFSVLTCYHFTCNTLLYLFTVSGFPLLP